MSTRYRFHDASISMLASGRSCSCHKPAEAKSTRDASFASLWKRLTPQLKLSLMNDEAASFWRRKGGKA